MALYATKGPIVKGVVTRESPRVYRGGPLRESDPLPRDGDDRECHARTQLHEGQTVRLIREVNYCWSLNMLN